MKTVTGYIKFKKFVVTTISTTSCVNSQLMKCGER